METTGMPHVVAASVSRRRGMIPERRPGGWSLLPRRVALIVRELISLGATTRVVAGRDVRILAIPEGERITPNE
jgi:hypothetical protein